MRSRAGLIYKSSATFYNVLSDASASSSDNKQELTLVKWTQLLHNHLKCRTGALRLSNAAITCARVGTSEPDEKTRLDARFLSLSQQLHGAGITLEMVA